MMKNLIEKEIIVGLRSMGIMVVALLLVQFISIFYINKDFYQSITDMEVLKYILLSSIMFFPFMLIPMVAIVLMNAVMAEEKKERILQVLFANGVSVKQIWRSKMIMACGSSYIISCIGIVIALIYVRIVYDIWIELSLKQFFELFILFPLVAIAVTNIIGILMWSCKSAQSFVGIIPGISYMACIYLSTLQIEVFGKINGTIMEAIIMFVAVLAIVGCEMLAKNLSKEYLIHVHS